jgi:hypothetical protein
MNGWSAGTVVGGRWRLLSRVPGADAVERWRAVAEDDGTPTEVLLLAGPAADPAARAAYQDLHRGLARTTEPGVVQVFAAGTDDDRSWVVRAPLEDATLADVPGPLPSSAVAWVGATLVPAVLAAGGATRSALSASDVGIDATGAPVLAPRGAPLNRVRFGSARVAAPEAFAGRAPDGAAGLYGLGVVLYRLATGREPLGRPDGPPPPPPSAVRHGILPGFDEAVLRLLSPDPGARAGALPLLQEGATSVDLRAHTRVAPPSLPVVTTTTSTAAPERPVGGFVVLSADALRQLGPDARSHAAGLARVPVRWVDTLMVDGLPLVLDTVPGASAARRMADRVRRETGLPVRAVVPTGVGALLAWTSFVLMAFLVLFVLVTVGAAGALFGALAGLAFAMVGTVIGLRGRSSGLAVLSYERTRVHLVEQGAGGLLSPAWERVSDVRRQLAVADLPAPAASDLRDALKEAEHRLQELSRLGAAAEAALRGVDESGLRTRLATLQTRTTDPATVAERDRLARTVADIDAVRVRRTSVSTGAMEVLDRLAAAAAALGQIGTEATEETDLVRVERSAARLRAAAAEREREG